MIVAGLLCGAHSPVQNSTLVSAAQWRMGMAMGRTQYYGLHPMKYHEEP